MDLGFSGELIFFAFLGLLLFGPKKLPEIARTVASIVNELKRANSQFQGRLKQETASLELEDPTKSLLGSLAEGLKAISAVRDPARAIAALAEPAKLHEHINGPSFIDNLSGYLEQARGAPESPAKEQIPTPSPAAETSPDIKAAETVV